MRVCFGKSFMGVLRIPGNIGFRLVDVGYELEGDG